MVNLGKKNRGPPTHGWPNNSLLGSFFSQAFSLATASRETTWSGGVSRSNYARMTYVGAIFRSLHKGTYMGNALASYSERTPWAAPFSPKKRITQTPAASHPTTWVILHCVPRNPTLPISNTTSFLPPWNHPLPHPSVPPPGLPHCRHSATRACHPHIHGYDLFPR